MQRTFRNFLGENVPLEMYVNTMGNLFTSSDSLKSRTHSMIPSNSLISQDDSFDLSFIFCVIKYLNNFLFRKYLWCIFSVFHYTFKITNIFSMTYDKISIYCLVTSKRHVNFSIKDILFPYILLVNKHNTG